MTDEVGLTNIDTLIRNGDRKEGIHDYFTEHVHEENEKIW